MPRKPARQGGEEFRRGLHERLLRVFQLAGYPKTLTQEDIAKTVGVSGPSVSDWINLGSVPRGVILAHIAHAFRVDAYWLLTGEGSMAGAVSDDAFRLGARQALAEVRQMIEDFDKKWLAASRTSARGGAVLRDEERLSEDAGRTRGRRRQARRKAG